MMNGASVEEGRLITVSGNLDRASLLRIAEGLRPE
jgi:hypothetical protein